VESSSRSASRQGLRCADSQGFWLPEESPPPLRPARHPEKFARSRSWSAWHSGKTEGRTSGDRRRTGATHHSKSQNPHGHWYCGRHLETRPGRCEEKHSVATDCFLEVHRPGLEYPVTDLP